MKILNYLLLILATIPLGHSSELMLDYYCGCRGSLEVIPGTAKITHTPNASFKPCSDKFNEIYHSKELKITGEYEAKLAENTRTKDVDGKPICNSTEIKDYLATYKKLQSKTEADLEEKVEVLLCRANTDNKGKKKLISDCREALIDLLGEHEKVLFDACKVDFRNRGKSKQIDKCVRIKAYELLLNTNEAKFFEDVCPKASLNECVQDIRSKLTDTYFKNEVAMCTAANGFNTQESVSVCKDVLVSKILAFSTNEERNKLLSCIKDVSPADQNGVSACVGKFLLPDDADEKSKLDEMKKTFCPLEDHENDVEKQNKCLEDLLLENLQDMPMSLECLALKDSTAQKKCQRLALYDKLLKSDDVDAFDCWNRKKFESMKERASCHDLSKEAQEQIKKCLEMGDEDAKIQCLQKVGAKGRSLNGYNIADEEAARALEKLLKEHNIDTAQCMSNKKSKSDCLKKLYDDYKAQQEQGAGIGAMPGASLPGSEGGSSGTNSAIGTVANGSSASNGGKKSHSDANLGVAAGAGATLAVTAGNMAMEQSGIKIPPIISSVFTIGLVPLIKNLKRSIKYRKNKNGSCRCLSKVGTLTVFDRIRQFVGTKLTIKKLDASNVKGQTDGVAKMEELNTGHSKNFGTSVGTSQVKQSQNAQCQTLAIEEHQQSVANNQPPPSCGDSKTGMVDESMPQFFVEQIKDAKNYYQAKLLFEEWSSFAAGDLTSMSIDAIDMELLKVSNTEFEEKTAFISTIEFMNYFISSAHAEEKKVSAQDASSLATVGMEMLNSSGADKKDVATSINKAGGSDPLAETQDVAKEATTEKKEYTTMMLQFLSQAGAMKTVKDAMTEKNK